jgi:hypothetical protein
MTTSVGSAAGVECLGANVDGPLDAEAAQQLGGVAAHGRGNPRPEDRSQLDGQRPDSPGPAMNQHGLPGLHGGVLDQSLQGRQPGQGQRGGVGVGHRRRPDGHVGRRHRDEFGRGAVAVERDQSIHLVARREIRYA